MTWLEKFCVGFIGLAVAVGFSVPLVAGETVQFTSPDIQPTPFKLKRAQAKGITLKATPGTDFSGLLEKPDGAGPFPAVVILISGGGQLTSHVGWAKTLADWGYITLLVDSFGARGGTSFQDTSAIDMTVDGFAAFTYLATRDDVDPANIGMLGFSMGGSFLFPILRDKNRQRPDNVTYKAAVSFYPTCNLGYDYTTPILILFGEKDVLTSLSQCRNLLRSTENTVSGVTLHVYDGATHFFDSTDYAKEPSLRAKGWSKPIWFESNDYDAAGHQDSLERTKAFFAEHLQ